MRLIKMFGLAAIAVGAFMAFLGASSALATSLEEVVLCKALEDPCVNGHYGSGTVLHGLATNPILLSSVAEDIECLDSKVSGELTSLLAHGKITALSWTHCLQNGEACTVENNNTPFLVKAELQSNHTGYETLVTAVAGGSRPSALAECPGIDCNYGATTILASVSHENGATVQSILQTLSGEGLCFFTSGVFHAKYEVKCLSGGSEVNCYPAMEGEEQPKGTSLEEVVLCKALEDPCTGGDFGSGTVLHATATDSIILGSPNLLCASSKAAGELTSLLAVGKITAISWLGCETSNKEKCTATTVNLPYSTKGELQSNDQSYELLVTSGGVGRPSVFISCGSKECSYGASSILLEVLHVSGVAVLDVLQTLTGIGVCFFTSGVFHAKYEVKCLSGGSEVNCYPAMEGTSLEEVVLCKALEDPCVKGHYGSGTVLHGLATNPILLSSVAEDIECLDSKVSGELTSLLAHGKITALSWTHCLQNGEACTVENNNTPFLVKAELQSNHTGYETLVTAVAGGSRPSALAECPGIDCNYGASTILAEALDVSGVAVLDILQTLSGEGFCFFNTGVFHAKYEVKCLSGGSEVNCYPAMEADSVL